MKKFASEKYNSANFTPQLKHRGLDSNKSLPALKSLSEFWSSAKSDSSFFDWSESGMASSIDIELDSNGQPIFDNMSANGDPNFKGEGEEASEEVPVKSRMARPAIKKKSAFYAKERNESVSSEESDEEA